MDAKSVAPVFVSNCPPWKLFKPNFIFDLRSHKKSDTNPLLIQQNFAEIKSRFPEYSFVYTDGSKDGEKVACAAVLGDRKATERLPSNASIFTAEARAIMLALKLIETSTEFDFIICSDSLSTLLAIKNHKLKNPIILQILHYIQRLDELGKNVLFFWVPSHVGIQGNTIVDRVAKETLAANHISDISLPYSDYRPLIRQYVFKLWQDRWNGLDHNKLHEIKPDLGAHVFPSGNRKEQVIISRCRIRHSRLTHGYLLVGDPQPECIPCDCPFSIKHVLLDCVDFADKRKFSCDSLFSLFKTVPTAVIIQYLKDIGLFYKM